MSSRGVLALVAVTAALAAPAAAAAASRPAPSVTRLWHAYPLGHAHVGGAPRRHASAPPGRVTPAAPAPGPARHRTRNAVLAATATALTVIAVIIAGRRRGWIARGGTSAPRHRRAGTQPRALALYAVAAAIGVVVGLLIPLIA